MIKFFKVVEITFKKAQKLVLKILKSRKWLKLIENYFLKYFKSTKIASELSKRSQKFFKISINNEFHQHFVNFSIRFEDRFFNNFQHNS